MENDHYVCNCYRLQSARYGALFIITRDVSDRYVEKQLKVHIAAEDTVQVHMLEEVKVMVHVLGVNSGDGLSGDGSYCWT